MPVIPDQYAHTLKLANGLDVYYLDSGGPGTPLVLVHGLWASSRFFHPLFQALADRYRVIVPDLRGHGRSSMTLQDQTVPSYAKDLGLLLDVLQLENYVGLGWSMGAFIWWELFAQRGRGGLNGLVVVDQPPTDFQSERLPDALISLEALQEWLYLTQTDRNNFVRQLIPSMFAQPPAAEDFAWMFDEMTRAPEAVAAATLVDQSLRDYSEQIQGYPVPTLVCRGAKSLQPAAGSEMILDAVKDARIEVFADSGHCLFLEESEAFNRVFTEFVESL